MSWGPVAWGAEPWGIPFVPSTNTVDQLRRISSSRVSEITVFVEITARDILSTTIDGVLGRRAYGWGSAPWSTIGWGTSGIPRVTRKTERLLFSSRPWVGAPDDLFRPNWRALPRIINAGRIDRSIPVDITSPRRGQRVFGNVELANVDGELDHLFTEKTLEGGRIRVWAAQPQAYTQDWVLIYEAVIDGIDGTRDIVSLQISTVADELERPLQLRRYTGTGGIDGDLNVKNRRKPMGLGRVWGAAPVLIDTANNLYAVNDGPIQEIDWVREGGLDYINDGDAETELQLLEAVISPGHFLSCNALGVFRIGTNLPGLVYPLRVGFSGDASGSGFASSTGAILYRLARNRAFLSASKIDLKSFDALPRASIGYYYDGQAERRVSDVFDDLLLGVGGWYSIGRGETLEVSRIIPPEKQLSSLKLAETDVFATSVERRPDLPRIIQPYTYAPTASPLNPDQLAPGADADVARRLVDGSLEGTTIAQSSIPPRTFVVEPLRTYFVSEEAAKFVAATVLEVASKNRVPLKMNLGQQGLGIGLGKVLTVSDSRFANPQTGEYRGVVYTQSDSIGGIIKSEVTTLG